MFEYYNGNIGIGTIYPQQKLDISGNINFTGNLFQGNQLYKSSQWENSNGIYYNGNVGIGTNYPLKELDISGNINFTGSLFQGNQLYKSSQWEDISNNSIRFMNGNVGIGTLTPSNKLDISGGITCNTIAVKDSWFIQSDSQTFRNQLQLQPVTKTFQVKTNLQSVFDVSMNGRYTASESNVNVFYNGSKFAYSNSSNYDFSLNVILLDASSTLFRVTLAQTAYYGDIVDILIYPQFLSNDGNKQPGYVYQQYYDYVWNKISNDISFTYGNLGIGTYYPFYKVHIVGDTRIQGNLTVNGTQTIIDTNVNTTERLDITNDGTGPAIRITQTGTEPIADFCDDTSSNIIMRIANGGNVGIGSTTPAYKFDVNGDINFTGLLYKSGSPFITSQWTTLNNNIYFSNANVGIGTNNPQQQLDVSNNAFFRSYVGIGTVISLAKLDVCGNILISNNSSYQVRKADNSVSNLINIGTNNDIRLYGQGGALHINPDSSISDTRINQGNVSNITMYNGGNIKMQVNGTGVGVNKSPTTSFDVSGNVLINNGNVGVGTSLPQQQLDVSNNALIRGNVLSNTIQNISSANMISYNTTSFTGSDLDITPNLLHLHFDNNFIDNSATAYASTFVQPWFTLPAFIANSTVGGGRTTGYSANFSGTNLVAVDKTNVTNIYQPITMMCWIYIPTIAANTPYFIMNYASSSNWSGLMCYTNSTGVAGTAVTMNVLLYLTGGASTFQTTSTTISQATWTHICIQYSPALGTTSLRAFINGTSSITVGTGAFTATDGFNAVGRIYVGTNNGGGNPFVGYIDDVRVYDKYLSVSDINNARNAYGTNTLNNFRMSNNLFSSNSTNTKLGIGTSIISYELDVSGNIRASGDVRCNNLIVNGYQLPTIVTATGGGLAIPSGTLCIGKTTPTTGYTYDLSGNSFISGNIFADGSKLNSLINGSITIAPVIYFPFNNTVENQTPNNLVLSSVVTSTGVAYGSGANAQVGGASLFLNNGANGSAAPTGYVENVITSKTFSAMTISFWWKQTAATTGANYYYFGCYSDTSGNTPSGPVMTADANWTTFLLYTSAGNLSYGSIQAQPGAWQHLLVTWDGTTMKRYLNGALFDTGALTGTFSMRLLVVGRNKSANNGGYYGYIDDFRLYDYALHPSDITRVYQLGTLSGVGYSGLSSGLLTVDTNYGIQQGGMVIEQRVGIGSYTPSQKLDISGNMYINGNISAGNLGMFRNRIINGNIIIDQRNAGTAITNVTGSYTIDRFYVYKVGTLTVNVQQVSLPATLIGFQKCIKISVGTQQASLAAGDNMIMFQPIEGNNISDLMWGTSSAQPVTVSFWIYASNTGTFSFALRNASGNRSFVTNYTIISTNTWQYVSATILGDTTGTWAADNTTGVSVNFCFGTGTTYQTTAGAWQAGNFLGSSSTTNFFANTAGAAVYITGIQLEKGIIATPFEFRTSDLELLLCQRYYDVYKNLTGPMAYSSIMLKSGSQLFTYRCPKRGTPTFTITTGTALTASTQLGGQTFSYNDTGYTVDTLNAFQVTIGANYVFFSNVTVTVNAEL